MSAALIDAPNLTIVPDHPRRAPTYMDRFWKHVDRSGECWYWRGWMRGGVGYVHWQGQDRRVVVVAYEEETGERVPNLARFRQTCGHDQCIRPAHQRLTRGPQLPWPDFAPDRFLPPPAPTASFAAWLDYHMRHRHLSTTALGRDANVTHSHISRLTSGQRMPNSETVEALSRALRLTTAETDDLLVRAGHAPLTLRYVGGWPESVSLVADVLNDQRLSVAERDEFSRTIVAICRRWKGER